MLEGLSIGTIVIGAVALLWLVRSFRVVQEYERGVVFMLGRYVGVKGAGLRVVLAPLYSMTKVDMRTIAQDVPPQDVITKDNVSVKVNAVIYFRVIHPEKAVLQVANFLYATSQLAQTTLRSILGQHDLDELLANREQINEKLQQVLDVQTDPWGVKIGIVELKHVDLPQEMQRVMAKQAEAERERRAKIINAEGEFQASQKLADAAEVLSTQPAALQLRYLQTLLEIAAENNSTTIFPVPIDFMKAFMKMTDAK